MTWTTTALDPYGALGLSLHSPRTPKRVISSKAKPARDALFPEQPAWVRRAVQAVLAHPPLYHSYARGTMPTGPSLDAMAWALIRQYEVEDIEELDALDSDDEFLCQRWSSAMRFDSLPVTPVLPPTPSSSSLPCQPRKQRRTSPYFVYAMWPEVHAANGEAPAAIRTEWPYTFEETRQMLLGAAVAQLEAAVAQIEPRRREPLPTSHPRMRRIARSSSLLQDYLADGAALEQKSFLPSPTSPRLSRSLDSPFDMMAKQPERRPWYVNTPSSCPKVSAGQRLSLELGMTPRRVAFDANCAPPLTTFFHPLAVGGVDATSPGIAAPGVRRAPLPNV